VREWFYDAASNPVREEVRLNGTLIVRSYVDPLGLLPCPPLQQEPSLESVCPECITLGAARLGYAGLARLIPYISGSVTATTMERGALAVSMRNNLKDVFRFPLTPLFSGVRQPGFSQSMAKYGGDVMAVIDASARTNSAINAVGASGIAIGLGASLNNNDRENLGVMEGVGDDLCGCRRWAFLRINSKHYLRRWPQLALLGPQFII